MGFRKQTRNDLENLREENEALRKKLAEIEIRLQNQEHEIEYMVSIRRAILAYLNVEVVHAETPFKLVPKKEGS